MKNSKLAEACDGIIHPSLKRAHTHTAGFGSFIASAVTCLQVSVRIAPNKFHISYRNALELSQKCS